MSMLIRWLVLAGCFGLAAAGAARAEVMLRAALFTVAEERPLPLSRLDLPPEDLGVAGANLAIADNNTTGRFLKQSYALVEVSADADGIAAAVDALAADGIGVIVARAAADALLALSDAAKPHGMLVLNAQATDNRLRGAACRANVLHVAPSRAMIADGLAQYLVWKKWDEWLLVHGSHPRDQAMADAYRKAAQKFGAEIVEERIFEDTGGARRSDSGHVQVQKQIPVFTQRAEDHDVIVVADESQVFGHYIPYRMWDPRPVAGDAGLIASMWHPAHESWGATQVQRRFEKLANRGMRDADYLTWLALRTVGEAVTRTNSADPAVMKDYLLSDQFQVAAFKGLALSYRPWNNQLRHGVILADGKLVVSVSPQEDFLHLKTRLDTLGLDEPENACAF